MALATAADLLNGLAKQRRYDERTFEGVGTFRAQSLSELERTRWQVSNLNDDGEVDYSKLPMAGPILITMAIVDDQGRRLFTASQAESIAQLDAKIVGQIVDWIQEHCGFREAELDTVLGNSEATPSDSLPSD